MKLKYLAIYVLLVGITFSILEFKTIMASPFDIKQFKDQTHVPLLDSNTTDRLGTDENILLDENNSSSSIPSTGSPNQPQECEMPPCPPGQACIQMCP